MSIFGIIVTTIYIGVIVIFRWSSFHELATMPLNEFGDFFAGVFGPLMLFWLILGYIQQQSELRQNTKALELQAEELKKSVEQHKELVKATREQVEADLKSLEIEQLRARKEAHPDFSILNAGYRMKQGTNYTYEINLINSGKPATNVVFSTTPPLKQVDESGVIAYLGTDKTQSVKWTSEISGDAPSELRLVINCNDSNSSPYTKIFDMALSESGHYNLIGVGDVS